MDFIYEKNKSFKENDLNKFVLAIFYYSGGNWTMAFCGNVLELVEKHKVLDDKEEFIQYDEIEGSPSIEVFFENKIISEFMEKDLMLIDMAIGELNGEQIGLLFIKKEKDVYG